MAELLVEGVSKAYGPVRALSSVNAKFLPGEVHAVLGENGAGKSTLMGVLSGFVVPDSGRVLIDGGSLPLGRTLDCRQLGIAMVHQHFTLVPDFTVAENLALAQLAAMARPLKLDELVEPALRLARELGWEVEPGAKARGLPVGVQQRIEILKSLSHEPPILILDEPTAVLAPDEVEDLFRVLRSLAESGKTVILIAHKLSEVLSIADRITVLRRGAVAATALRSDVNERTLAEWMVGELPAPTQTTSTVSLREQCLSLQEVWAKGDRGEDALRGISLEVQSGEVVGIGGVDGNGQVELAEVAVGVRDLTEGFRIGLGTLAYIPQDRQGDGLAMSMTILENMMIEGHRRPELSSRWTLKMKVARKWGEELVSRFQIKTPSVGDLVSSLSGGNQQKVVVSRSLDQTPGLLVCVNPTRGLDIRAASFVHSQILLARDNGAAVLLISTDLDELAALSNRTLYISGGRLYDNPKSLVGAQA